MIENIDIAYCMAKLEDNIRWEWSSAEIYRECSGEDLTYWKIITRWSNMITAFNIAFGVSYNNIA